VNAAIAEVAKRSGAATIDMHAPLKARPELFKRDGIHPTPEGSAVMARVVAEAIRPALKSGRFSAAM
jgi:lysophospholipase L1-like esterase